jgi:hypothetical protein
MMRTWALVIPALAAACTTMEPPMAARGPCAVDERVKMRFAGMKFRERMRPEIEQATNAARSRILRPGDITTKEFLAERLNIMLDDGGEIEGLRCG